MMSHPEYYRHNHSNTFTMGNCQEVSLSLSLELHLTNVFHLSVVAKFELRKSVDLGLSYGLTLNIFSAQLPTQNLHKIASSTAMAV